MGAENLWLWGLAKGIPKTRGWQGDRSLKFQLVRKGGKGATPMLCGAAATAFEKKIKAGLKKPSRPVSVKNIASIKEKAFALGKADS